MNPAEWQSIVDQFHHSGLSISAFAKQHNLVYHQLLYRIQKYRERHSEKPNPNLIPVIVNSDRPSVKGQCSVLGMFLFPSGARLEIYDTDLLRHLSPLLEA